jgi:hypothetical protein
MDKLFADHFLGGSMKKRTTKKTVKKKMPSKPRPAKKRKETVWQKTVKSVLKKTKLPLTDALKVAKKIYRSK